MKTLAVQALVGGPGPAVFVGLKASSASSAAAYGGLFAPVMYGVDDSTNFATLRQWPLVAILSAVAVWAVAR